MLSFPPAEEKDVEQEGRRIEYMGIEVHGSLLCQGYVGHRAVAWGWSSE